ncbi:MAG: hypothetical protein R3A10_08135 [Caldilineaceae bacterium]
MSGLGDDDHHQYLRVDGVRAMSGNLNLAEHDIINVRFLNGLLLDDFVDDLQDLKIDVLTLQARTVLAGDGIDSNGVLFGAGSPTVSVDVSDLVGDGLRDDGSNNLAINPEDFAGAGLMAASYDLHVGAGTGVTVGANAVNVDEAYDFDWTGDHTFAATLGSPSYASGFAGGGWRIDSDDASMQLNDLTVRGIMRVYELLVQQIRATNGSVFISAGAKVGAVNATAAPTYDLTVEADEDDTNIQPFAVGDLIRAQRWTGQGTHQTNMQVSGVNIGGNPLTFRASLASGDAPTAGMEFVRLGNVSDGGRQGSIYLSADDNEAPFIDIVDGVSSFSAWAGTSKVKARLGNLNGLTDETMGVLTEYGLYTQNAFLRGTFAAGGGNVWITDLNGLTLKSTSGAGDGSAWITFHTDPADPTTGNRTGFVSASKVDSGGTVYGTLQMYVGRGLTNTTDIGQIVLDARDESDGYDSLIRVSSGSGAHEITISAYKSAGAVLGDIIVVGHGSWEGNIIPGLDSAYDLGSNSVRWRRIYADEIIAGTSSTIDTGHTHTEFLTEAEILALLAGKAPVVHTHAGYVTSTSLATTLDDYVDDTALAVALADYTTTVALTALLANKSPVNHNHNTLYYLKAEVDGLLTALSAAVHEHDDLYYTETEIDGMLEDYVTAADLATTLSGYTTLTFLASSLTNFISSTDLTAALGAYSLSTHSHTTLPLSEITYDGSATIDILSDGTMRSANYVSGRTGFSLGPNGLEVSNADIRGTMRSGLLQTLGAMWISGSQLLGPAGKINDELTITAIGSQVVVPVADGEAGHHAIFAVGDILKIAGPAYIVTSSNSENSAIEPWLEFVMASSIPTSMEFMTTVWLEVDSIADQTTHFEYTCTVKYGPRSVFSAGAVVGSYGTATTGRIEFTSDKLYAPYMEVFTTGETPWSSVIPHLRIGRLDGLAIGATDRDPNEHGLAAATDLRDADGGWLITSNQRIAAHNLDIEFTDGVTSLQIDAEGGFKFSDPMTEAVWGLKPMGSLQWYDTTNDNVVFYIGPAAGYDEDTTFNALDLIAYHHKYVFNDGSVHYAARVHLEASPLLGTETKKTAYIWLDSQAGEYVDEYGEDQEWGSTTIKMGAENIQIGATTGTFWGQWVMPDNFVVSDAMPRSTLDLEEKRVYVDDNGFLRVVM